MNAENMDNEGDDNNFCELCSLEFSTNRELEEHTWSMLHNTNLNKKQGRDCVHPCSLCKQQFIGLLEFTSHLHGDNHQEKIHEWRKEQQQEWTPDKQQQQQNPDKQQPHSPDNNKEEDRPPSDWAADDLSGLKDFSDHGGEPAMDEYHNGYGNLWGSLPGRGSSRGIPSLLDLPQVGHTAGFGFDYQQQSDIGRGRGMPPPNQPWPNDRWEYQDRNYPNDGHPTWNSDREPTDRYSGPLYNPRYTGMNHVRNSDEWQNERPPGNRDGDRYLSRDRSGSYPNDNFSDNYAPGPRRRDSFDGDSEFRPRFDDGPRDLRDRITKRNNNSSHPSNNGRRNMKSVVGSSFLNAREREGRPNSRGSKSKGHASSQKQTPPGKHSKERNTSLDNRRDSKEKSHPKTSPSSGSPSGKSSRKGKPRKLARWEEKKGDVSTSGHTVAKSFDVNSRPAKNNESEKKNRKATAGTETDKNGTESSADWIVIIGDGKNNSKMDKSTVESNDSKSKESTKPQWMKKMMDSNGNTCSSSTSSTKGDSSSSAKGNSSSSAKKDTSSSAKGDSSSSAKGNSLSSAKKDTPSSVKGDSASSFKENPSSPTKGNSSLPVKKASANGNSASSVKGNASSSTKGDSASSAKGNASSPTKENSSSPVKQASAKGNSSSSVKGNSSPSAKGDFPPSTKSNSSLSAKRNPPSSIHPSSSGDEKVNSKMDKPTVESSDSKSKESTKPLWMKKMVDSNGNTSTSISSTKGDSSSSVKGDPPPPAKRDFLPSAKEDISLSIIGDSSSSAKRNPSSSVKGDTPLSAKGDSSLLAKVDSTPFLETGGSSLIKAKEKKDPILVNTSNKQKDFLSSLKENNALTTLSKGRADLILLFPKKDMVASLGEKNILSQNSREAVNTLPVLSEKKKDTPAPKLGEVSLSSTREKSDLASNFKEQMQSSSAVSKHKESYLFDNNSSLPGSGKEKTVDNRAADISSSIENKHNYNDSTFSSSAIAPVGSLPWGQREEKLRSLLGIKKEPKDVESQKDTITCAVSSSTVTMESPSNRPVTSGSISSVTGLTSGSNKSTTSKNVPVVSQLSLSRPQCSFVHIDGVQCGAITYSKYCSYHQRVFQSEESNTHVQGLVLEGSHESPIRSLIGRQGGTQIFRPTTPPYDPPERFGVDEGLDAISGVKADHSSSYNKYAHKLEKQSGNDKDEKSSEEIDLNSTVSYTALGAATDGPHRSIDLGTTMREPARSLLLHGSSADISSGPSIDLFHSVPRTGRTLEPHGTTLEGTRTMKLPGTTLDGTRTMELHGTTLDDTRTSSPGIDLSGTVPNLEGLLALHGSSATDKSSGPKINLNKTVLKHGRSWNPQSSSAESRQNIDLNATGPYRGGAIHLGGSSVGGDNGPNIDLSETVSQPGRSRTPLDNTEAQTAKLDRFGDQAATATKVIPSFIGNVVRDVAQKRSVKTGPETARASPTPNVNTEMIDLNFSTKLLGVPHSVVTPFNTSVPSPKKPGREMTKSPSEYSTKSSILASPRSYVPSPPQSPLTARRVSTSPMPGDQAPASTISPPNLSLDLSRFNLPVEVRKALAERYSGKKVPSASSGQSVEFSDGRRSQPLFTDHTRAEGLIEHGTKLSPLPARLRSRGQRSISLDSPIIRKENLHGEGSSRSMLLERGNVYDTNRFLSRPFREISERSHQTGLSQSGRNSEGLFTGSNNVLSSTNVPSLNIQSTNLPEQGTSNELQSRGLIDLSSTSYLEGISVPSTNQGRQTTEATQLTIDNSRSPSRPSVLQSQGLIDLNTSTEFGARDVAMENPESFSVMKRKRVNSYERSETSSSFGAEKLVKRLKQEETSDRMDTAITYRPGINVQELLSIERDEQDQLQNLHTVQSRLKSVRAQIQKLCTELDSLSSEEQRITLKMGELRNLRLSILENACYERQGLAPRVETVTRESRLETVTRKSSTSTMDDSRTFPVSLGSGKGDSSGYSHKKIDSHNSNSTRTNNYLDEASRANARNDYQANDTDVEQISPEVDIDVDNISHGDVCSSEESLLNASKSSDDPVLETHVSVGAATKFVLRGEPLHAKQPHEKVPGKLNVASKRSPTLTESSNEVDLNRGTKNTTQKSGATSREFAGKIPGGYQDIDPGSFDGSSEQGAVSVPVTFGDPGMPKQNDSNKGNETRKDPMKKIKHTHLPEKVPCRKKIYSDVNVSKTIEAGRKKIQSARENMKRWKEQEAGGDVRGASEAEKRTHSSTSSTDSIENPSSLDEQGSSPRKIPVRDKTSGSRKTTKELKKSSLFHSGKKSSKEGRKNKVDKAQKDKEKSKQTEAVPSKRRKIDDTSCNKPCSVPSKGKTSSKEKGQVVSAAAHTTTTDLGGSGTEERSNTEDEIPTRDVDGQTGDTSSNASRRASHLQIPSSTVESLKKSLQNSKEGRQHRGPLASKFTGHTGAVCGLKVHNGHLFTCSADKTTRSFNIHTGQCVKLYQGHHQGVNCVEASADKDRLFTGSNDQTVRSYNIKSGVCTHKFTFDGRVMCLHFAFDLLFVGLSTGIVASIDLLKNKCLERLHCHEPRGVSCLTTATEGQRKLLCSGSFDSTISIRDCKSGLLLRTFSDHNMTVLCLQVVENILYSGSADMKVQAHNLNSGELLRCYEGHTMSVSGLQIVGRVLVTSCLDKLIRCYDLATAELIQVYGGQVDMIFSVHVNNGRIYSGARDGSVVAVKLDLRVYHPCKWRDCQLNFGIVTHLKNHIREYHVMEQGTVEACHWANCGHQFSADDEISVVLKHVLGHVVTRTARKTAS